MEAVRNGSSGSRLRRPGLLLSKEIKPLKIVESRDVVQDDDPYKELELYLAKVNVSMIHIATRDGHRVRSLLVEIIFLYSFKKKCVCLGF